MHIPVQLPKGVKDHITLQHRNNLMSWVGAY
jgi:hypothetical protein